LVVLRQQARTAPSFTRRKTPRGLASDGSATYDCEGAA
jgi:hypothetical protein